MKFPIPSGHISVILALSVTISACNSEEYYPLEEFVKGGDAFCYRAKDLNACEQLVDKCQPAFTQESEEEEPKFAVCVANPDPDDHSDPIPGENSDDPTSDDPTSGDPTSGDPTSGDPTTGDPTTGDPTTGDPTTGDPTTGDPTTGDPTTGDPTSNNDGPQTIGDVLQAQCSNLDPKYVWEKQDIKKGVVLNTVRKVKLCHKTGNGSSHTIVIACPALKPHVKHHDDYLGSCQL